MSQNNTRLCPIPATKFYSNCGVVRKKIEEIEERQRSSQWSYLSSQQMPQRLLGPTQDWEVYFKQADALDFAKKKNSTDITLLTFVYEHINGHRQFIVAHPEVFWWRFNKFLPEKRCAYEVIPEGAACSLYLDLEFQNDLNPKSNGPRMTKTIIDIIFAYMKNYWGIICNENNVLNMDSTTYVKFSRHVILRIKNVAFKNNIHVGRFIKNICADIDEYLATGGCAFHDTLSYFEREHLEELIIETGKRQKIFVDTGVYTRNRHFRIYKATKWGKLSHLELAPENKYIPLNEMKDKELGIFLESLISYFPDTRGFVFLEVNEDSINANKYTQLSLMTQCQRISNDHLKESPYPAVDKFILDLVHPGTIRGLKYYENSQIITYEICGNRFCFNIGRQHKSNGIYWVADLKRQCAYQKCHDKDDCENFRSVVTPFPCELSFLLDEEDDDLFFSIPDTLESSTESTSPNNSF